MPRSIKSKIFYTKNHQGGGDEAMLHTLILMTEYQQ